MSKRAVVALGGNAFTAEGESGDFDGQTRHARTMAAMIVSMLDGGWELAIAHGNGPQVGNLAIQQENGASLVPAQPLSSLVAMTQGALGSIISCAVHDASVGRRSVAAITTHVVVGADDPAMRNPTKPIGPFMTESEANRLAGERGWTVRSDSGRGFRRVVASPTPTRILEIEPIKALLAAGHVVVAVGGGGIPVIPGDDGQLTVVDAVVDKDYAAARLATAIGADALVIVTGVDAVQLDFGTDRQRAISSMNVDQAEQYLAEGQFPEGSMGPKIRAAVAFIRRGGSLAIITSPDCAAAALHVAPGGTPVGTRIVPVPLVPAAAHQQSGSERRRMTV